MFGMTCVKDVMDRRNDTQQGLRLSQDNRTIKKQLPEPCGRIRRIRNGTERKTSLKRKEISLPSSDDAIDERRSSVLCAADVRGESVGGCEISNR